MEIKLLNGADITFLPTRGSDGAAAMDLRAHIPETIWLSPGEMRLIPTGIALHIKDTRLVGLMFPRSGKGSKEGLVLANGTGVIDSDYQGEIFVAAVNRNFAWQVKICPGERIAQLVLVPVVHPPAFTIVEEFSDATERGDGGFGSSGK
jgi:dUTP pyrophosphatase